MLIADGGGGMDPTWTLTLALAQDYNNQKQPAGAASQSPLSRRSEAAATHLPLDIEESPYGVRNGVNRVLVVRAAYLI